MLKKDTVISVTNRDKGSVGYNIPDLNNLNRQFQPGEVKEVTFEELERLSWVPGGRYLLENCLMIDNEDAIKELIGKTEPEYYYTEEDVKTLLTTGTLDQFLDCLDFAPQGVLDMIKNLAVSMPLNDVAKRKAIQDKLGFNVDNAINLMADAEEDKEAAPKGRRTTVVKTVEKTTERKAEPIKIIKKQ